MSKGNAKHSSVKRSRSATVGAADHAGWAVLVTVAEDGTLLDRRRVELLDASLPSLPHHHDCQGLPLDQAVALIGRVQASAERHAAAALERLAVELAGEIRGIALRRCPPLPESIAERISNYRAQNVADTVLFRNALAQAAIARGYFVHWYEVKTVFSEAARALGRESIEDLVEKTGTSVGPPWQKDHRTAMAAAIAAAAVR